MGLNVHVIECNGAPSSAPTAVGQHWVDTVSGEIYFSVGTSSVSDWINIGDHGSLAGLGDDDHPHYLTEARHDGLPSDNPHSVTFSQAVSADGGTDISTSEAETLTDGSNADALHDHNHDNLTGFLANEHLDHTTINFNTTEGVQGGGNIAANRTLRLDISGLTTDSSPDSGTDYLATFDASAGSHKKVLLSAVGGGGPFPWDACVDSAGGGDFTSIRAALDAGKKTVFVKDGTYVETGDLIVPSGGIILGESPGGVIVSFNGGAYSIKIDGSGGTKETAGTVSLTNGSKTVTGVGTAFNNLSSGDYIHVGCSAHKIDSITNATSLQLSDTYQGRSLSGASYFAQTMAVGCQIGNLIVVGSVNEGLYARAVHHLIVKDSLFTGNGTTGVRGNIKIEESTESFMVSVASESSKHHGMEVDSTFILHLTACVFKNNETSGLRLLDAEDIIVDGCNISINDSNGVNVEGTSDRIHLNDTIICSNAAKGIDCFSGTKRTIIDGCTLTDNGGFGIDIDGSENVINDCMINGNTSGGVIGGDNGIICGCQISDNTGWGIDNSNDGETSVNGNRITNNSGGGVYQGQNHAVVANNVICDNGGPGVQVIGTEHAVTGNTIRANTKGIYLQGADLCSISGNMIDANTDIGLHVPSGADDNTISGNVVDGSSLDGIQCGGDDNILNGNRCGSNGGNGIEIQSSAANTIVTSNNMRNNSGTNYVNNGSSTTAANNKT